jgi:hypothetical protein
MYLYKTMEVADNVVSVFRFVFTYSLSGKNTKTSIDNDFGKFSTSVDVVSIENS